MPQHPTQNIFIRIHQDLIANQIPSHTTFAAPRLNQLSQRLTLQNALQLVHDEIKRLQLTGFDQHYLDHDNNIVLIRNLMQANMAALNPVHPAEAEIQALRYLRGMILICLNTPQQTVKEWLWKKLSKAYRDYETALAYMPNKHIDLSKLLITNLSKTLELILNYPSGLQPLIMAKDLSILLEYHPAIYTISHENQTIIIEKSQLLPVAAAIYDEFLHIADKDWFQEAKSNANLASNESVDWLNHFFNNHYEALKRLANPAPPTARWLPIPGNQQTVENYIISNDGMHIHELQYYRTGTLVAYDISDHDEQLRLAFLHLKSLYETQLIPHMQAFKDLYHAVLENEALSDFYFCYQTLLSPLPLEEYLPHKDNNARFVTISKQAMAMLKTHHEKAPLADINLQFNHSNLAINKNAFMAKQYSEDEKERFAKMALTRNVIDYYQNLPTSKALAKELRLRERALTILEMVLEHNEIYSALNTYQRNLLISALEYLMMGKQAFILIGCKSGRDRTTLFCAALKSLLLNELAYMQPLIFMAGILQALQQGHYFSAMLYHAGIIKINAVHKEVMQQLPLSLQQEIIALKAFTKKVKLLSFEEAYLLKNYLAISPSDDTKEKDLAIKSNSNKFFRKIQEETKKEQPAKALTLTIKRANS